jgi:prepilin-type N-terminal cleavage/methylation domain-containing protein
VVWVPARSQGLSLIEVLMAVTLVGILAAVAIPSFTNYMQDAHSTVTRERMSVIKTAILGDARIVVQGQYAKPGFLAQVGKVPDDLEDLVTQGTYDAYNVYTKVGWNGPYVSNVAGWDEDAWGEQFIYSNTARTLRSKGPNKTDDSGASDDIQISLY